MNKVYKNKVTKERQKLELTAYEQYSSIKHWGKNP